MKQERITAEQYRKMQGGEKAPWSRARKTWACPGCGHVSTLKGGGCPFCRVVLVRFDSKHEATVFAAVLSYTKNANLRLLRQVRFPLLSLAGGDDMKPLYITIDFVLMDGNKIVRLVDPKGRKSREWERGKRALEAWLSIKVEEA